jgi:feruloyl esterase
MKRETAAWVFLGAISLATVAAGAEAPAGAGGTPEQRCAQLQGASGFASTTITKTQRVLADARNNLPAFCEVTATISPVSGSKITALLRLPDNWNGKMLGLGGGGWSGNITLQAATIGLARGYAMAQTDGGHPETTSADPGWVRGNPVAVTDFSHRAVHETAVLGKQVVARFYGRASDRNYFQGCSTGGRMAMMETQRYPDDYDGVIAGAPVYSLLVQTSNVVRDRIFRAPGAEISVALMRKVNDAAVAACDKDDGLADGVLNKPYACKFDPVVLQCRAGADPAGCLTPQQVRALREAYTTTKTKSGIVGNYGLTRGSEAGWNPFVPTLYATPRTSINGSLGELVPLIFGDAGFYMSQFDIGKHQAAVHQTPFAQEYEAASTDLSRFFRRGGKLILWHGMDDPGPSALATADYYTRAVKQNGGDNLRYYGLPGVYHCAGGPGADQLDTLTALEQWVERGVAPGTLVARNTRAGFERPACQWPATPRYTGGDAKLASSFRCE